MEKSEGRGPRRWDFERCVLFDLLRVSELEMTEESMATSESVDIAFLYR
jgi:hypothetical protein